MNNLLSSVLNCLQNVYIVNYPILPNTNQIHLIIDSHNLHQIDVDNLILFNNKIKIITMNRLLMDPSFCYVYVCVCVLVHMYVWVSGVNELSSG